MTPRWIIYGATGYSGTITSEAAVRRAHHPILAGRNEKKLRPLAERLGLESVVVDLDDQATLEKALAGVELVLHEAGPFSFTAEPMRRACLATNTHYLDVSGEIDVLMDTYSYDEQARDKGIVLMSGVGVNVIATDCLAKYVADQIPGAVDLELARAALGRMGPGTSKTSIEEIESGTRVLRDGQYQSHPLGEGVKKLPFPHRKLWVMPVAWGDLATAYRTTGIPNITVYMSYPPRQIERLRRFYPLVRGALAIKPVRKTAQKWVDWTVKGPDEEMREKGRSYVWARADDAEGNEAQAWLETVEGYKLTVEGSLNAVELVLGGGYAGALTPAEAFGADFVMGIEGTKRYDSLS
jgi:short subunit dehydrogenase-like uncharacterized protein